MSDYRSFIDGKAQSCEHHGFAPVWMPDFLFDFQQALIEWAQTKGRAAIFADCGMGKSVMELVWGENVVRHTNGNVLLLTPLAVSGQIEDEAKRFGIEAKVSRDGTVHRGITIANYERLHLFRPDDFTGAICDESGILKNFQGATRQAVTQFMRKMNYRLLATATAAPNDFSELGTSSEALGYLGHADMLARFFKNDQNNCAQTLFGRTAQWRLKGHAELPFWRWVCSWARALRKPSDLGFSDRAFILPPLHEYEHMVQARKLADGMLFALPAAGLQEQREERRRTLQERCEYVADVANSAGEPVLVWCHLNDEGDLLERLIPDAVQVSGKDSDDAKEEKMAAFSSGQARVMVSKQKIAGWGMNWQHCAKVIEFPSHSYEASYQSLRRCYRFGQKRPVHRHIVTTEGEGAVLKNLQRKAAQADKMFDSLVSEMNAANAIARARDFDKKTEVAPWL